MTEEVTKKPRAKKSSVKKSRAKKAVSRKAATKKSTGKKSAGKKAPVKQTTQAVSTSVPGGPEAYDEASTPKGLSKEDRVALKGLAARSDTRGLTQLAGHLILIAAAGVAVAFTWGTPWYLLSSLALGVSLIFLFAPLHETIHRTAFKTRWINDAVGYFAGFVLVLPPNYFRAFHLEHHRYTQIEDKDPELDGKRFSTLAEYLWIITGFPVWKFHIGTVISHAIGRVDEPYIVERQAVKVRREAAGYLGLYIGLAVAAIGLGRLEPLIYWVIPVLLGQPFLRLYLMAEHGGCPLVADMFRNTRTTLTNPIVRFLAWNMPYHVEHHAFMAVPFHRLPEAHNRFKDRIEFLCPSYTAFHKETVSGFSKR